MTNIDFSNKSVPSLLDKIMQLQRCCERLQSEVDRQVRISEAQCVVLRAMPEAGELHTGEICQRAGLSPSRGGRVIEELVRSGWAERVQDPADRRVSRIRLTAEGQERRRQVEALLQGCETALLDQLDPAQRRTVEATLELLLSLMHSVRPPAP